MVNNSDDGWTHVPNKRGKSSMSKIILGGPPPPAKDLSLADVKADYEAKKRTWMQSDSRKQLRQILKRMEPDDGWQLKEAVCMATGSFNRDNWENRKRSMRQFVVFMDIVQYVQGGEEIDIYAQDPRFTELDSEFLSSLGVQMLPFTLPEYDIAMRRLGLPGVFNNGALKPKDLPAICGPAAEHFGPSSFVCEFFMEFDEWLMTQIFHTNIKLLIGTFAYAVEHRSYASATALLEGYTKYHFPRFEEDPNVFDGLDLFTAEMEDLDEEQAKD